jgi:hypothetical protein
MSVLVNGAVSDEHRATMISLFGFITRVQFLLLGALVPFLAEWGYLSSSIFVLGAVATLASYYALRPAKN